jgi:formamidopyrimidine-DNA glycosylase
MPELPDIALYLHALEERIVGRRIGGIRLANPFLLRSVAPPLSTVVGLAITALHRLG